MSAERAEILYWPIPNPQPGVSTIVDENQHTLYVDHAVSSIIR